MAVITKIFTVVCMLSLAFTLQAQKTDSTKQKLKVAIFDPDGIPDKYMQMSVREMISTVFVNTGEYTVLEREELDKIMKEQQFSNSGVVDDKQAIEMGKLAGADKAVLSVITNLPNGSNQLSEKLIDIKTGVIEQQKLGSFSFNNLSETVNTITLELIGKQIADASKVITFHCEPFSFSLVTCQVRIIIDGKQVWQCGREGFQFTIKDKNPGKHSLQVSVEGSVNSQNMAGGKFTGGYSTVGHSKVNSFDINTADRDNFNFKTGGMLNPATVKLEKNKK